MHAVHSIVAGMTGRPSVRFARPTGAGRIRRLGLAGAAGFEPAAARATVLRRPDLAVPALGRPAWRTATSAPATPRGGASRPSVTMHWARSARQRADRRAGAAPASWPG